jgi:hypothetical protein
MESGNQPLNTFRGCAFIFLYEVIGTFFLLTAINFSNQHPITVPCGIFMGIMLGGNHTGGHFNFAVSVGVYIS